MKNPEYAPRMARRRLRLMSVPLPVLDATDMSASLTDGMGSFCGPRGTGLYVAVCCDTTQRVSADCRFVIQQLSRIVRRSQDSPLWTVSGSGGWRRVLVRVEHPSR